MTVSEDFFLLWHAAFILHLCWSHILQCFQPGTRWKTSNTCLSFLSEWDVTLLITSACWVAAPHGSSFLLDHTFRKPHGGHGLQHSTVTAFPCSGPRRVKDVTLSSLIFKWTPVLWFGVWWSWDHQWNPIPSLHSVKCPMTEPQSGSHPWSRKSQTRFAYHNS